MADEMLFLGFNLDFWYNALFAGIDIFFGVMLWFVDNRGKRRQEESMKRQDESLDIILEQISKVNIFQTRVLSLAIETLEKDIEEMKQTINSRLIPVTEPEPVIPPEPAVTAESTTPHSLPSLGKTITSSFQAVLRDQLTNMMEGLKKNLGDLPGINEEESYKVKKGLEFDLKNLVRGLEGLDKAEKEKVRAEKKKAKMEQQRAKMAERIEKRTSWTPEVKEEVKAIVDEEDDVEVLEDDQVAAKDGEIEKEILSGLEEIESLKDLGSFASSILESVGKSLSIDFDIDRSKKMQKEAAELKKDLAEMKPQKELYKRRRQEIRDKKREQMKKRINKEDEDEE